MVISHCHALLKTELVCATQAMSTQEANRAASNKMPPLWAAAAIVLLGWNEFVAVLYNPLWLALGLILFLFGKVRLCPVRSCGASVVCSMHQAFISARQLYRKQM